MPAGTQAASVAVAFTAPRHATPITDAATCARPTFGPKKGSRIHGASMAGHVSELMAPSVVSVWGDSAYRDAAMT